MTEYLIQKKKLFSQFLAKSISVSSGDLQCLRRKGETKHEIPSQNNTFLNFFFLSIRAQ